MSCCTPVDDAPGCAVDPVEACVCDDDPYCCDVAWDSICVGKITSLGCGTCTATDVVISSLETPSSACIGDDLGGDIQLALENIGLGAWDGDVLVHWYLSEDSILDSTDIQLGSNDLVPGGIPPNTEVLVEVGSHLVPLSTERGSKFLIAQVDGQNNVAENDEQNNLVAVPLDISCNEDGEWHALRGSARYWMRIMDSNAAGDTVWASTPRGSGRTAAVYYDSHGSPRWEKTLPTSVPGDLVAVQIDDSGDAYVLTRERSSLTSPAGHNGNMFRLSKFESDGDELWSRDFDTPTLSLTPGALTVNASGDLVVSAHATQRDIDSGPLPIFGIDRAPEGYAASFLVALDANGDSRWTHIVDIKDHFSFDPDPDFKTVEEVAINDTGEGRFIASSFGTEAVITSFDSAGTELQDATLPPSYKDLRPFVLAEDGTMIAFDRNTVGVYSSSLDEQATIAFDDGDEHGTAFEVTTTNFAPNGDLLVGGRWTLRPETPTSTDVFGSPLHHVGGLHHSMGWLARFSASGTPLWVRTLSTAGTEESSVFGPILEQPDGQYLFGGGFEGNLDIGGESLDEPLWVSFLTKMAL